MTRLLSTAAILLATAASAGSHSEVAKIGVILGFTGPIESLTPAMAASAEAAMAEVTDSGLLLDGLALEPVRADSTCIDSAAAVAAAEGLLAEDIVAIYGPDCSGVTTAVTNQVGVPNGLVVISPSATSPALTTIEDNGFFFRTAPSDARQGEVLAAVAMEKGVTSVAITYTNNDYGKGLADSFQAAFEALGGSVAIVAAHEDGKGDYSAEVAALSASGAEDLAVLGYVDQGGRGIIQASLDTGAFERFVLGDGMIGSSLTDAFGADIDGTFGTAPGAAGAGAEIFAGMLPDMGITDEGPYRGESYDAAALIALAIQAAGSTDRAAIQAEIMNVANAPGEEIFPGELAKGLQILADGGEINYQGATNVEFTEVGEAAGAYLIREITGGAFETTETR